MHGTGGLDPEGSPAWPASIWAGRAIAGDLSRYAAEPALFSRLLGIHGRTLPPRRLGFDGALRVAWRLVASAA